MSAYAVPVDWRITRVLHTVKDNEAWNVPQLADDLGMDIEETQELMVHVGLQIGIEVAFVDTSTMVLH